MSSVRRVPNGISVCSALLLLVPPVAGAQVPSPPKTETVTLRAVAGAFELKGTSSADLFGFKEQCGSESGYAESTGLLTLPLEFEAGPNDSLEDVTRVLRDAVARGLEVSVEPSSEQGKVTAFYWTGVPLVRGVVLAVDARYTMYHPKGHPVRATATLNIRFKPPYEDAGRGVKPVAGRQANTSDKKKQPDCSSPQH